MTIIPNNIGPLVLYSEDRAKPFDSRLSDRFQRFPISELAVPRSGMCVVYADAYWAVDKDDNVFIFERTSPQCNRDPLVAARMRTHPDMIGYRQIAFMAVPCRVSDYV